MRKLIPISMALFYSLLAVQLTVNVHSCMGQIVSVSLSEESVSCCGSNDCHNCCDNQTLELEEANEEKLISSYSFVFAPSFLAELPSFEILLQEWNESVPVMEEYLGLPPPKNQPLYLLHSSFTFYG